MTHPYATMAYAQSLAHWGKALQVPQWKTSLILRAIEGGGVDAIGNYPFAALPQDADIAGGLAYLRDEGAVSVTLVLDDFHRPSLDALKPHFTLLRPFKTHYVHNPAKGAVTYDSHHKRALKKAQALTRTGVIDMQKDWRNWQALYDHLIMHLKLSGLHAFPAAHHEALAQMNGFTGIGAWIEDALVSAHIWAEDGETMHSHLVASNQKGYDARAAYAVNDFSLKYFSKKLLNFGGGAGQSVEEGDGLARFKRGFSNDTAQSYLCGAILDPSRYETLTRARNTIDSTYFPAYRAP